VNTERDRRHFVQEQRSFEPADPERFDRLAFAIDVLRALDPPRLTVAVYRTERGISVDRGRDPSSGENVRWAVVGIPPHASRSHIVHALAELAGVSQMPYVLDALARSPSEVS
jgi:hypothetical protein